MIEIKEINFELKNKKKSEKRKKLKLEGGSDWNRFTFWQGKYEVEVVKEEKNKKE